MPALKTLETYWMNNIYIYIYIFAIIRSSDCLWLFNEIIWNPQIIWLSAIIEWDCLWSSDHLIVYDYRVRLFAIIRSSDCFQLFNGIIWNPQIIWLSALIDCLRLSNGIVCDPQIIWLSAIIEWDYLRSSDHLIVSDNRTIRSAHIGQDGLWSSDQLIVCDHLTRYSVITRSSVCLRLSDDYFCAHLAVSRSSDFSVHRTKWFDMTMDFIYI